MSALLNLLLVSSPSAPALFVDMDDFFALSLLPVSLPLIADGGPTDVVVAVLLLLLMLLLATVADEPEQLFIIGDEFLFPEIAGPLLQSPVSSKASVFSKLFVPVSSLWPQLVRPAEAGD